MLLMLKHKALKTIYGLLRSKSEQECELLFALVNKLGDPNNKGASDADFHLSNLLSDHSNMKAVVIDEDDPPLTFSTSSRSTNTVPCTKRGRRKTRE